MNYSQLGQDLQVLKFYGNKRRGYFVEIGASDGIQLSNTYLLEQHGWKGICVEPIPFRYAALVKNRPNSICVNKPVYNESDKEIIFDICNTSDFLSGISDDIDKHKKTVDADKVSITCLTVSLNHLLGQTNAPNFIEYLSLDTEGSEYEILRTFDFSQYTFGLIDVEHNYIEPRRTQIRELLEANDYIYIGENNWDDMYKHKFM